MRSCCKFRSARINCSANREFGDFQTVALDNAGHAVVSYDRVAGGVVQTMFDREL